jgi:Trichohyalin-plectin-homology domain
MDLETENDNRLALLAQTRSIAYTAALASQLSEKDAKKESDYLAFLHEKQKIDTIVQKILDENAAQQMNRFEKREETREYINKFLGEREVFRKEEEERRKVEEGLIEKYVKEQDDRVRGEEQRKKSEKAAQELHYTLVRFHRIFLLFRSRETCKSRKERDLSSKTSASNCSKLKTKKKPDKSSKYLTF